MSLSKQLYIIIAFIFFLIFSGNFLISIKNTKEYLEIESSIKAQDVATSLGLSLRPLIKDKKDPEIESIIKAISNSGFHKEIRLEDVNFTLSEKELIEASTDLDNSPWQITKILVDPKYGYIEKILSDEDMNKQLSKIENESENLDFVDEPNDTYFRYVPSEKYKDGGNITFDFTANYENKNIDTFANLDFKKVLIKETRNIKFEYIPQWFINLIPIHLEEKFSEISNGWNTSAIIYVSPNPGEAYAKLYEEARNTIIYTIIAFIISMFILFIFIQFFLSPLKKIEVLAKDIAKSKFGVIEKLPWTTEIKNVAIAMNDMSRKIETIRNKLNKNLESLSKKLSEDDLTKLNLRPAFETDLKQIFIKKQNGYILSIKIDNLSKYAKIHTDEEVDKLIIDFANILNKIDSNTDFDTQAYRFFGSEFVMIAKNCNYENIGQICNTLKEEFNKLAENNNMKELAHIGASYFNEFTIISEILQASNEAYEKAKLIGPNEFFITEKNESSRDMNSWRDLIFEIIDNSNFNIDFINHTYNFNKNTKKLIMQEAFSQIKDKDNNNIPIGSFISIAENYEKIIDFDKSVISKIIEYMQINNIKHDICINLSLHSISNNDFIIWLQKEIAKNKNISSHLIFSLTAYSVEKDMNTFKTFCDYIHSSGSKVMVKRFETKLVPTENLKELNLDYIRLARDYTSKIKDDRNKKQFIESIKELCDLLNIKLIAEDVKDEEDYKIIEDYKLYGASR